MLAKSGQLRNKVTEEQLKDLLASLSESQEKEGGGKIVVSTRGRRWDEEDDDDLFT
jgi:programmed cell death protein 5